MVRCAAKSKQSGEQCRKPATPGSKVCHIHGSKSLKGMNAPNFKHGGYSKHLPSGLLTLWEEADRDPELNNQRHSITLIDTLIMSLLPGIQTPDSRKNWHALKKLVTEARQGWKSEDIGRLEKALDALEDLADQRILHHETLEEVRVLLDDKRRHQESIVKLEHLGDQSLSIQQVMLIMSQLLNIIQTTVRSPEERSAIADEIQRLIAPALPG